MAPRRTLRIWAAAAALFGVATVVSGGRALFDDDAARAAVGQAVGFVLWFNFIAGFAYMAVAAGLWRERHWAALGATLIAGATAAVGLAFAVHVASGGAYEMRTVGALALRLLFWLALAQMARCSLVAR